MKPAERTSSAKPASAWQWLPIVRSTSSHPSRGRSRRARGRRPPARARRRASRAAAPTRSASSVRVIASTARPSGPRASPVRCATRAASRRTATVSSRARQEPTRRPDAVRLELVGHVRHGDAGLLELRRSRRARGRRPRRSVARAGRGRGRPAAWRAAACRRYLGRRAPRRSRRRGRPGSCSTCSPRAAAGRGRLPARAARTDRRRSARGTRRRRASRSRSRPGHAGARAPRGDRAGALAIHSSRSLSTAVSTRLTKKLATDAMRSTRVPASSRVVRPWTYASITSAYRCSEKIASR